MKKYPCPPVVLFSLLAAFSAVTLNAQNIVWDSSTDPGYQNVNGTWGVDAFWTPQSGAGSGTVLSAWTPGGNAWFGGNGSAAATPSGNFTITVSGSQQANLLRQVINGSGDFTLTGGSITGLGAAGVRADQGTFTVNSDLSSSSQIQLNAAGGNIVLGGSNSFTSNVEIRGSVGSSIRLDNANALGTGNSIFFINTSVDLDLNGNTINGNNILVNNNQTGFMNNTSATDAVWSGNVGVNSGTANIRAGGTNGEVNITGVVSVNGQLQARENGTLRLSGANTHTGLTVVRNNGTLIVNNTNALGAASAGTVVNNGGTLDLNGFALTSEAITLQQTGSRLINSSVSGASSSGTLSLTGTNHEIGGTGDITLSGAISGTSGFTKTGTGELTLSNTVNLDGDITVDAGILTLSDTSSITFTIGANGVNNTIAGTGSLNLDGMFTFDLSGAGTTIGDSWLIFDADTLTVAITGTFTVNGFTDLGSGLWTFDNGTLYEFNQGTGALIVIPEPSAYALFFGVIVAAGAVSLRRLRARRAGDK